MPHAADLSLPSPLAPHSRRATRSLAATRSLPPAHAATLAVIATRHHARCHCHTRPLSRCHRHTPQHSSAWVTWPVCCMFSVRFLVNSCPHLLQVICSVRSLVITVLSRDGLICESLRLSGSEAVAPRPVFRSHFSNLTLRVRKKKQSAHSCVRYFPYGCTYLRAPTVRPPPGKGSCDAPT